MHTKEIIRASYPWPTFEGMQNVSSHVWWKYYIIDSRHMLAIDESVMWAGPQSGDVSIVTHVHGVEVLSYLDGHPDAWFTAGGDHGRTYDTELHIQNSERATMF